MRIGKLLSICTILFVGLVSCRATPPPVTSCLIQVPPEFQPDTTPIDAIAVLCVSAEGEEFEIEAYDLDKYLAMPSSDFISLLEFCRQLD